MAASAGKSLTGTLLLDDGSCTTGAVPAYDANGAVPQLAPSRASSGLGGSTYRLPLILARTDTGLTLTASSVANTFSISNTTGTSLALTSENANNGTKTDKAMWEWTVPQFYKAGDNLTVTVNGLFTVGGGTATVKTIAAAAYLLADAGTSGATLIATAAQTLTATAADYAFVVTGTTLTPGARVLIEIVVVLTETASSNINATINSVRVS